MTNPENAPKPSLDDVIAEREHRGLRELTSKELGRKFSEGFLTGMVVEDAAYVLEAADRLARFDRLQRLLGLLAPGGTAPRTALEQIYVQSDTNADESAAVLDLRHMLAQHWGDWTPALREAEGLPPEVTE